jgi:Flp pilus assembly protein CpaB
VRRRSNLLVLLGLASFVLGLVAVYLVTSDDDDDASGGDDTVEVLVAAEALTAGELGEEILSAERYRISELDAGEAPPDAVIAPSQLSGAVLTLSFAEGEVLRTSGLRVGSTTTRPQIPEGFEAVTVAVDFVAGGANTIAPNDRINVFLVVPNKVSFEVVGEDGVSQPAPPPFAMPRVELLLTNTLVLDVPPDAPSFQVSQTTDPSGAAATGTSGGNQIVLVLAVDTIDAEKVIFANEITDASLYLSRVRVDDEGNPSPPVESTPGVDFTTILAEEAGAAFRRSDG